MAAELENLIKQAMALSPLDKVRLVEQIAATLERDLSATEKQLLPSLYGLCADLGSAPSAEEIEEVRQEVWRKFPHEDI